MTETFVARQAADNSPALHYYVTHDGADEPEGLLVEEFLLAADYSSAGLVSGGWNREERQWRDASATSRRLRVDAALRARVTPVGRAAAAASYWDLCGADLLDEPALRACFGDHAPQAPSALRLSGPEARRGFRETRIYRILLTDELTQDALAALSEEWQMPVTGDLADPEVRILGAVRRQVAGDAFRWDLRRVAAGAAWGLDVTCDLVGERDEAVGVLLRGLTTQMRQQGLIPVTIDRFR
ncbi:hypothetical protein O7622_15410 [Micromonospora sp. WMMD1076]|uniref:hypothetical protein n=1 Tax=Micromonospora sp. WMMD1076 TaxID=3016103 RepID=UPI002499B9CF|nr:hypothetical protein [Micromonospora sp. WMMD1076]WFF09840.1 hypothetical protein O7622_15410 [Micromonospora sp. WMMD1076]